MIRRMLMVEVEKGVMTCQIRDDENRVSLFFNLVISLHKSTTKVQVFFRYSLRFRRYEGIEVQGDFST